MGDKQTDGVGGTPSGHGIAGGGGPVLSSSNSREDVRKSFTHVRVVHNFRGSNNDELCMKKDDVSFPLTLNLSILILPSPPTNQIITLTQTPTGGWWEGTLTDGTTGWFPANYVTPLHPGDPIYESAVLGLGVSGISSSNLQSTSDASGGSGPLSGQFGLLSGSGDPASLTSAELIGLNGENINEYRDIVIKDIEDSENVFIHALQDAISLYLKPMYQYKM